MSFLLECSHHGHHRRVRDLSALEKVFVNLAHRRAATIPDDLHDLEFLIGKYVFGWLHIDLHNCFMI